MDPTVSQHIFFLSLSLSLPTFHLSSHASNLPSQRLHLHIIHIQRPSTPPSNPLTKQPRTSHSSQKNNTYISSISLATPPRDFPRKKTKNRKKAQVCKAVSAFCLQHPYHLGPETGRSEGYLIICEGDLGFIHRGFNNFIQLTHVQSHIHP